MTDFEKRRLKRIELDIDYYSTQRERERQARVERCKKQCCCKSNCS